MAGEIDKKSSFSNWYNEILKKANIVDVRYPVKGLYTWHPFGFKLRNLVYDELKRLHEGTGHDEVRFPLLIPEANLQKESEHVASFEEEVFWIDRAGKNELDEPLALRPTSETAMYPLFAEWIRSHTDLPFKIYQIVNTFRYETKHTRPLIREREISSFKEAHTAHKGPEEARKQIEESIEIYSSFFDSLGIPYFVSKRPSWDKFPGSEYTIAFDTLMPDGKALQIGTIHNLGTNFSKTFDVQYEDEEGEQQYVHQTCFGISARCVAAVIGVHGDNTGLIFPPKYAPTQVVVIPIIFSDEDEEEILQTCRDVKRELDSAGIRVEIDESEDRPGKKFYKWELKGTPLRIEIGPRDLENEVMTLVRRNSGDKKQKSLENPVENVEDEFKKIDREIAKKAQDNFNENVREIETTNEGVKSLSDGGAVIADWCGKKTCGKELEEELSADILGSVVDSEATDSCIKCGEAGENKILIAKTY
ncbi:Prolyl-tRNA synthetase [Methanonatronarchaeum thermophilum]|uniref:Proline--tRNA ligase n=1 Tax=Methanonatronarchaeum thermophilum TaxID=1927129 RepID=A0A1Y3GBZ3_9EURY|nr:proline--tRNA ligase [Methanonatronarchaeum thermophilum]OUJ18948.1 Prolyl-tRNA synthetase [Methanonatronarchaeum thermophilum]